MMQIGSRLYDTSACILHFAVLGAKLFGGAWTLDAVGAEPISMAAELTLSLRRDVAIHKLVSDDGVAVLALDKFGDTFGPVARCVLRRTVGAPDEAQWIAIFIAALEDSDDFGHDRFFESSVGATPAARVPPTWCGSNLVNGAYLRI